jgi:hypothetical protein
MLSANMLSVRAHTNLQGTSLQEIKADVFVERVYNLVHYLWHSQKVTRSATRPSKGLLPKNNKFRLGWLGSGRTVVENVLHSHKIGGSNLVTGTEEKEL